jgi:hypothetical protein
MDSVKGKSRDLRLSQALACPVVQKAACGDLDSCDLSPSVSPRLKMVSQYTFGPLSIQTLTAAARSGAAGRRSGGLHGESQKKDRP